VAPATAIGVLRYSLFLAAYVIFTKRCYA